MKILIIESKLDVAKMAAKIIERQIRSKPKSNIGLATGKTMIPLYHELVNLFREKKIDFSKVKTFNLDEYFRVNEKNRKSFHYYMNKRFFSKVNINKENIFFFILCPTIQSKSDWVNSSFKPCLKKNKA